MRKLLLLLALLGFTQAAFGQSTHVRGAVGQVTNSTTLTVTLGAAPATGSVVLGGVALPSTGDTASAVKDSNNNTYTISSGSPSTFQSGAGKSYMFYLLSAPSNATATINITITSDSNNSVAWADVFTPPASTTASFDKDAKANTGTAGTTINTPSITPSKSGNLLYAIAAAGGTISAPAAGATLGSWTGAAGAITAGDMAEYILNSGSSATAVQFTQSSGGWSAMAISITFTSTGSTNMPPVVY